MGDFLETLTLSQLREIAKEENFRKYYSMPKLDIVELLVNHLPSTKLSKYKLKYQTGKSDDKVFYMIKPKVMVDKTKFRSFSGTELTSILYLMYKYPQHCIAFSSGLLSPSGKLTSRALGLRPEEFNRVSLGWSDFTKDFIIPEGLWKSIKNCLKRGSEFIIIPFGFYCSDGDHANFLIYNSLTRELERFEPYGYIYSPYCKSAPMLDEKLAKLFNKNVNKDMVKAVYDPLSFCPLDSFQIIQEDDKEFKEQGENGPWGYCSAWSFWYADMRLANPLKSRSEVVSLSIKAIHDSNLTFTTFIRSYADFLQKVYEKITYHRDEYPEKIIKKILKKNE